MTNKAPTKPVPRRAQLRTEAALPRFAALLADASASSRTRRTIPGLGPSGAKRFAPPCNAQATPSRKTADRRKCALAAAARRVALDWERRALLALLHSRAKADGLSLRKIARRAGLHRRSLTRLIRGQVDLDTWLPRLREAVARIELNTAA